MAKHKLSEREEFRLMLHVDQTLERLAKIRESSIWLIMECLRQRLPWQQIKKKLKEAKVAQTPVYPYPVLSRLARRRLSKMGLGERQPV